VTLVSPFPHPSARPKIPRRVVALGGGTGLPAVLRGLRETLRVEDRNALTAIVTMADDGGSSGRLRRSMGAPPPGDVRNCLVALSEDEELLAGLFQHRYEGGRELGGHSVGNLILVALAEQTGSFLKAVEVSSNVLRIAGRILPATQDDVRLKAVLEDGTEVVGETRIAECGKRIRTISLIPDTACPTDGVVEAILQADLVVLGPGSLYTSVIPNLLVRGVAGGLQSTPATVVLVANLVSERNEAAGLDMSDHLTVIEEHVGRGIVDAVLVNDGPIESEVLARYKAEGASPLHWPQDGTHDVRVVRRNLLGPGPKLRHDPTATAEGLLAAWDAVNSTCGRGQAEP